MPNRELIDSLSERALKNCTAEFNELAKECSLTLATLLPTFDGSMLTLLMQEVEPNCWPNPEKAAYYANGKPYREATMAMQRNYFTSAANLYLPTVAYRGPKVEPKRAGTHDRVCRYTSRIFQQKEEALSYRSERCLQKLVWGRSL
jgi:hypothetical protein